MCSYQQNDESLASSEPLGLDFPLPDTRCSEQGESDWLVSELEVADLKERDHPAEDLAPLDLDIEFEARGRAGDWFRRYSFVLAFIFSWLFHLFGLAWVSYHWPQPQPVTPPHIPVEIVYFPVLPKKSVEPPKQVEAIANENHQAMAAQAEHSHEATAPQAQPATELAATTPPVSVPVVEQPPLEPVVADQPEHKASMPPPPTANQPRQKPQSVVKTAEMGVRKPIEEPLKPDAEVVVKPLKSAPKSDKPVMRQPVKEPALPSLSMTPSLGEMARWDLERHRREQQEVYKRQEETVNLNTQKVRYAAYFSRLKERIQQGWIYPSQAKKQKISGTLSMSFTINQNGAITDIKVLSTSGSLLLDDAAVHAVQNATPFMPLPEDWALEKLHVKTIFEYVRGGFRWSQ